MVVVFAIIDTNYILVSLFFDLVRPRLCLDL